MECRAENQVEKIEVGEVGIICVGLLVLPVCKGIWTGQEDVFFLCNNIVPVHTNVKNYYILL